MATTTFLLVRHAEHELPGGVLAGRMPGLRLSALGRRRAGLLGARLSRTPIAAVRCSPRERCQETAAAIGLPYQTAAALDEIDFGAWTGRTFAELRDEPLWRAWNENRAAAHTPAGETMAAVQARMLGEMRRLAAAYPDQNVAVVGHADPIKAVVLWVLGASLDRWDRLEVDPAGLTTVSLGDWGAKVLSLNERVAA